MREDDGRHTKDESRILTGSIIPWEDNRIFQGRRLILYSKRIDPNGRIKQDDQNNLNNEMAWHVIDPVHGEAYEAPFCLALDMVERHSRKYLDSGIMEYKIFHHGVRPTYFYLVCVIERMLVFRIFRYHPIMINKEQGAWEMFRLIFHKDQAWEENREGNATNITEGKIFYGKSIYKRLDVMPETQSSIFVWNDDEGFILSDLYNEIRQCDIAHVENWSLLCDAISPLCMARLYFLGKRKQHFNSGVPKEIIEHLAKDDMSDLDGYFILRSMGPQKMRAYIGKNKMWLFRRNEVAGYWYSSNRLVCKDIFKSSAYWLGIDFRKIKGQLKNTMFSGCVYSKKFDEHLEHGFLEILEMEKEYASVEQACKIDRYDLADAIVSHIKEAKKLGLQDGIISKSQSLPEVFGISGRQLKFIPDFRGASLEQYRQYKNMVDNDSPDWDIETVLSMSVYDPTRVGIISSAYKKAGRDALYFFRALRNKAIDENKKIIIEYSDYLEMRPSAIEYLKMHPETPHRDLPEFTRPSRVHDVHQTVVQLKNMWDEEQRIENDAMYRRAMIRASKQISIQKEKLADLEYADGDFIITLPNCAMDIKNEGIALEHCVGSYVQYVSAWQTIILFVRKTKEPNTPYFTMEVHGGEIRQFFGFHDCFNKSKKLRSFINKYAKEKKLSVKCKI